MDPASGKAPSSGSGAGLHAFPARPHEQLHHAHSGSSENVHQVSSTPNSNAVKIQRSGRACRACRSRKQRCDGAVVGTPCTRCSQRGLDCSYERDAQDPRFNPYARTMAVSQHQLQQAASSDSGLAAAGTGPPGLSGTPINNSNVASNGQSSPSSLTLQSLQAQIVALSDRVAYLEQNELADSDNPEGDQIASGPTSGINYSPATSITTLQNGPLNLADGDLDNPLGTIASLTSRSNMPLGPFRSHGRTRSNDPVVLKIISQEEAQSFFNIFFDRCHPLAPFLDVALQRDASHVRSTSTALFLAIVTAAARYWNYRSPQQESSSEQKKDWLHPRYARLAALLDAELSRLALNPVPADSRLESVEAFLVYGHWFPLEEVSVDGATEMVSRYRATSCFHIFGQAIRWACLLGLDRDAHVPFGRNHGGIQNNNNHGSNSNLPSHEQLRRLRVYAYLVESDHHLASLAHLPISTDPRPLCDPSVVAAMRSHPMGQPTDSRVMAILQLAAALHRASVQSGDPCLKHITYGALQAFNGTLDGIEGAVLSWMHSSELSQDNMLAHMPFTSIRWARLALNCASLGSVRDEATTATLQSAVSWASQMLYHLSIEAMSINDMRRPTSFHPHEQLVERLSFSIDQYFLTLTYAAVFLSLAWHHGLINKALELAAVQTTSIQIGSGTHETSSLLYRLITLCAHTFSLCSPPSGHTARSYIGLLTEVARTVSEGPSCVVDHTPSQLDDPSGIQALFEPTMGQFWDQFTGVDALRDLNYSLPLSWPNDWLNSNMTGL